MAKTRWRWTALVLALTLGVAGCAGQSGGRTLAADEGRFRVTVPDGWQALATDRTAWADHTTVALLATQALAPQCAGGSDHDGCTAPMARLDDGAMLVWWRSMSCVGASCELPDDDRLLVGGRQAVRTDGTHVCDALGATHEVVYLVTVTPQRVDALVVCDRNAPDATHEQLSAMLEGVVWRTP